MEFQEAIVVADDQPQDHSPEPTHQFSMLRLSSTDPSPSSAATATAVSAAAVCDHLLLHPPCTACGCQGFNSMKKRSPETDLEPSRAKKPSREPDACDLTRRGGFTAISLPASLENLAAIHNTKSALPILRRCISDPYTPPSSATAVTSPENVTPSSATGSPSSASRLPPRPPCLKRCVSDPVRSPSKTISHVLNLGETVNNNMEADFSKDETSKSSMRFKRKEDQFKELKQWWDKVMQEDEQEEEDGDKEGDKLVSNLATEEGIVCGSGEEVVSVEWVDKCLSINFKCPCGEGYQILLSGNKCYYKLI